LAISTLEKLISLQSYFDQSVIMTQLPLLVDNLVNWYIWKAKITKVNNEYLHRILYYSKYHTDKQVEHDTFFLYDGEEYIQMEVQYRSWDEVEMKLEDFFIYRYAKPYSTTSKVALLPSKYYYSSGSSNPRGFLSETHKINNGRSKHYWLPDFFML
jgi:hypothetical protein